MNNQTYAVWDHYPDQLKVKLVRLTDYRYTLAFSFAHYYTVCDSYGNLTTWYGHWINKFKSVEGCVDWIVGRCEEDNIKILTPTQRNLL